MHKIDLTIRNTHFVIQVYTNEQLAMVNLFNKNLITYQSVYIPNLRKLVTKEDRRYYYKVSDKVFHYSIHLLRTFISRSAHRGITKDHYRIIYDQAYKGRVLNSKMNSKLSDRDHQLVYIEKVLDTNPISLVNLPTGKGKTYISMRIATALKYPTGVVVLSRYIEKWISDIKELTTATDDDIYVVKGRDSLIKLLDSGIDYEFVIFSLSTLRNYIKTYDIEPDLFNVAPERLFKVLGLKMMLNDEVHQSFHASYMVTIRINPVKVVSLSATLENLDKSISLMYNTLYPEDSRCGALVSFDTHPIVIAVNYYLNNADKINISGTRGYSHVMFEQSMLRNRCFREQYIEMLLHYVNIGYMERRTKGAKLLVLVQTVALATLLTNYLNVKLSDVVVNRYVEEDPYEHIIESDITVSTNQSAGTALDIPRLITVLQTVSMRSLQGNIQALGRLREIKGTEVRYYYTYSSTMPKQHKLHTARKDVISHLAKEYRYEEYIKRLSC